MTCVLIVDDKAENLYLMRAMLQGHGYQVDDAHHGAEALVKARQSPPQLIISDLLMPVMDGYTLLRHWRADERLKNIPFVVYTATYTEPKDEKLALDLGADAFILKPAEPEPFMARIRDVLAKAEGKELTPPRKIVAEEEVLLKEYSEVLVRKLETKMFQLEQANRALESDIAERKRAEEALRESEASTRLLVKSSNVGLWDWDLVTNEVYFSPEWKQQLGHTDADLPNRYEEWENRLHPEDLDNTLAAVKDFLEGRRTDYDVEFRLRHKDGSWRWILTRADLTRGAAGRPIRMMGCHVDITERKLAEAGVRESEERLRSIIDTMFVFVGLIDLDGRIGEVNNAPLAVAGLKREDVLGRTVAETFWFSYSPEVQKKVAKAVSRAAKGETVRDDYLIRVAGEQRITIDTTFAPLRDPSGKVVQIVGSAVDVTERKQAEEAVRESEERFSTVFKAAPGSMMLFSMPDGKTVEVNDEFSRITGLTREEAIGKTTGELEMWADPRARERFLASIEKDGLVANFEADLRHCSGTIRNGLASGHSLSIHGKDYLLGVFNDITELKRAETERRVIFEIIQGIITTPGLDEFLKLVHRLIGKILYAENCFVMLHDPVDDMVHFEFWADKYDPPPPPRLARKGFSNYVLHSGEPLLLTDELAKQMQAAGEANLVGSPSPSWLGVPLRTPERTIGVLVLQHDEEHDAFSQHDLEFMASVGDQIALAIERKWAEEAVKESEHRYRELVENARDIIYTHDFDGNYLSANKAVEDILGYTIDEAVTQNLTTIVAPEYRETTKEMLADLLAHEESAVTELEVFAKDGRRVPIEVNAKLLRENGVPVGVQGIARDITERKNLEGQLRQALKLEVVGQLAGGIAHDFNNLLTAISGYSELSLRKLADDDPVRLNILEIAKAGERATELTRQLLAFSRKQVLVPTVHNLNSVIAEIEKMLRRLIRENIELRTVLDPELGNIKADPGQIEQVIVNLAVNARDAMPAGGTLTIKTENKYLDEAYVSDHIAVEPGHYVRMTVTDTGEGMDETIRSRIFEPFFTTKAIGSGTGLGLSTVHGIVSQSGGGIQVYSEIGHGTSFKIYLPCVDETVQKPRWRDEVAEDLSGTETILLVEDDDLVRKLAREILTGNGYNVLDANSGKAALSIAETHLEPIHLVLTDVIMPGMNGFTMTEQLLKLLPDIKVVFMSGYTDDSIANKGVISSGAAFIEKPFTPNALARKVREVLASAT